MLGSEACVTLCSALKEHLLNPEDSTVGKGEGENKLHEELSSDLHKCVMAIHVHTHALTHTKQLLISFVFF